MNPSPLSSPPDWQGRALLLLLAFSLWRLGYLFIVPLDLGPDEAYYWDWSRQLDWGYFSKPPLIAWINAATTGLLGIFAPVVRLPAVFLGALGLWGLFLAARQLFDREVAFWSLLLWLTVPASAALGLIMATDVLLICCWSLALWTLWNAIEDGHWSWKLASTILIGFGILGKQMMLVFPLLMLIYLGSSREDRWQLKCPWPWLVTLGSLLFLLPPLWWNAHHGWITFRHTAYNVAGSNPDLLARLNSFGAFIGSQLGLLSPLTWGLLLLIGVTLLRHFRDCERPTRFVLVFSLIGLLAFILMSFKKEINANWPATFYPAGMILLAAWGRGRVHVRGLDHLRRWFSPAWKLGALLLLIGYLLPFVSQSLFDLGRKDPSWRIRGWQQAGLLVAEQLQQFPRPQQTFVLGIGRKHAAEMAFYLPQHPRTYRWGGAPLRVHSQYEVWKGPGDKIGWDALILVDGGNPLPADLPDYFRHIEKVTQVVIEGGGSLQRRLDLYRAEKLLSWPQTTSD